MYILSMVSVWADVGMNDSAVTGNGKVFRWYNVAFDGREDRSMVKEELQPLFKVKRDVFTVHEVACKGFCVFRPVFQCFMILTFGLSIFLLFYEERRSLKHEYNSDVGAV